MNNTLKTYFDIMTAQLFSYTETHKRSAWARGVNRYALDMLDDLMHEMNVGGVSIDDLCSAKMIERVLLNGAQNWQQYSESGCALCYDTDIAARLCAPWELRKTDGGRRAPNRFETWIDVQARALFQAAQIVKRAVLAAYRYYEDKMNEV